MLASLMSSLSLILCIQALGIFVPLDINPVPQTCAGWKPVILSISANPQVLFFSIVNPSDGPGNHGSQPSDAIRQCVQRLRPGPNATVLGYINTDIGKKSQSDVQAEIDTYAGWNSSYRPTGIFFDAVPSKSHLSDQYKGYSSYARGRGFSFIGLDPGEMPDPRYFSAADLVNVYESPYADFSARADLFDDSSTPISKQSVWLTEAPTTGSYSAIISQMVKKGVAAVYISDLSDTTSGIPIQWASFVDDVDKANAALVNSSRSGMTTATDHPSTTGGLGTGKPHPPQATEESPQPVSGRPPIAAIVGGTLGGLATVSVLLFIIIFVYRSRPRQRHTATEEEIVHPFTNSRPSIQENNRPASGVKRRFTDLLGNFPGMTSPWRGNTSTSVASQSIPASSVVTGLSNGHMGLTTRSSMLGESHSTRWASTEPPPIYSP